jgi:hypothetical protein
LTIVELLIKDLEEKMSKKVILIIVNLMFIIFGIYNLQAATYYVDNTSGNDSASGNQSNPWKRCPGMRGYSGNKSLNAGDKVYFDSADTWTLSGGSYGFWITGGVTYIGDTWGNGVRAKLDLQSSYSSNGGVLIADDHPSIVTEFRGFEVDLNSINSSRGVQINYGSQQNWETVGAIKRVKNCHIHHAHASSYSYPITTSTHHNSTTKNIEIIDCIIHNSARTALSLYAGYEANNALISDVLVKGNVIYNGGQNPTAGGAGVMLKNHCENVIIEENYIHNNRNGVLITKTYSGALPIRNVIVRNNIVANNINAGIVASNGISRNVKVYNNLVFNNGTYGYVFSSILGSTLSYYIYGNTFYNNSGGNLRINGGNFSTLAIRNNILYPSGISGSTGKITTPSWQTANYIFSSNPGSVFKNTSNLPTGFNSSGIPNKDGLSLASGSGALNDGTNLGSQYYNTSINKVTRPSSGAWDAGAYESGSGDTTPPAAPTGLEIVE